MPPLDLVIEWDRYLGLTGAPDGCTVGKWKELLGQGLFGDKILYSKKLVCKVNGVTLTDDDLLPVPPVQMCISGTGSVVTMLEIALKKRYGAPATYSPQNADQVPAAKSQDLSVTAESKRSQPEAKGTLEWWRPRVGDYRLGDCIGTGFDGKCVYKGEHIVQGTWVAVKWPAKKEEVDAMEKITKRLPPACPGIPRLLVSGTYQTKPFAVMDLLGTQLSKLYPYLYQSIPERRWAAMRVVGRMVVRRLRAVHDCGFVHCDVSPENIVLGRSSIRAGPPYLIDFGLARRYPHGGNLPGYLGSMEWSSIRSADGGERRPEDDLEAVGWMMLNGCYQELPWFACLQDIYDNWKEEIQRHKAVKEVQRLKMLLLTSGWEKLGRDWNVLSTVPIALWEYLRESRQPVAQDQRPNYSQLLALLGAKSMLCRWCLLRGARSVKRATDTC
eukprot:gnl/TRDRNA2_/TRDRNA2_133125_c0_seq1.p1 gnl/TRDRNA2_/TRDRNA2_133125_c0~~gnl/TRDRNA2_/TRDRNA2_133125_c0_seq1.p1  ORF type:complete len:442 (+),score=72.50 gnl/TRDRNA2_/TRDRNA2_133125_c0_seq1:54-1379(+)